MPNRPKGKYLDARKNPTRKRPGSARSQVRGGELADGKYRSMYTLHLMEATGTDMSNLA